MIKANSAVEESSDKAIGFERSNFGPSKLQPFLTDGGQVVSKTTDIEESPPALAPITVYTSGNGATRIPVKEVNMVPSPQTLQDKRKQFTNLGTELLSWKDPEAIRTIKHLAAQVEAIEDTLLGATHPFAHMIADHKDDSFLAEILRREMGD